MDVLVGIPDSDLSVSGSLPGHLNFRSEPLSAQLQIPCFIYQSDFTHIQ